MPSRGSTPRAALRHAGRVGLDGDVHVRVELARRSWDDHLLLALCHTCYTCDAPCRKAVLASLTLVVERQSVAWRLATKKNKKCENIYSVPENNHD